MGMKLICRVRNEDSPEFGSWDRGLMKKFNATPLLVKPQHEFQAGTLDPSKYGVQGNVTYCDYVIDVHRFPYLARQTAERLLPKVPSINWDFGLVVEAREDETLPERMLMCAHLEQFD